MKKPRVVVTGLGVVSSIGLGWKELWNSLLSGKSGIDKITTFDTKEFSTHRGGEVKNFDPSLFLDQKKLKHFSRASQYAIAACKMALEDSKANMSSLRSNRTGVCLGTTMSETQTLEAMDTIWMKQGPDGIPTHLMPQYPSNVLGINVAREIGCTGPNMVITTACAAGNYAISYAFDMLRLGRADVMIAGGTDAFSRIAFTGFNRLFAVAPERCQPFDKNRKGMLLGEGSGILILERFEDAR